MSIIFLKAAGALGFILLLIAGMAFAYKKKQSSAPGLFQLMAYHSFGPRLGVAALRVGHEVLILGVTNNDLKLFRVMDVNKVQESPVSPPVPVPGDMVERLRKIKEGLDG